jgi:outer membrane protein assembly factor BamD
MKPRSLAILLLTLTLFVASCGDSNDKVKNENEARPGRDKELYEQASKKLRKGRYDEARLLFNVVITTYPDSEYLIYSKLAIADSFYLEGGSVQLEQAIGGYKDFVQFFPTHSLTCDARLKIAESYMRQIIAFNRDASKARQAEFQLQAGLQSCQNSPLKAQFEENLRQVQQVLGLHELDVARTYKGRGAFKSVQLRTSGIVEKYPHFTYRDTALFWLGQALIEQEQPEEAVQYFTELVRDYPNSEHAKEAKEYLERLGKPIPAPSNDNPPPPRPGFMGRVGLMLGHNPMMISKDGVLVKKGEVEDEKTKQASTAPVNAADSGVAPTASSTAPIVAPATTNPTQPGATKPASNNQTTTSEAKPAETNKPAEAKKNEKKDPKKKEKKGFFKSIFR